jgi:hypothetical protein
LVAVGAELNEYGHSMENPASTPTMTSVEARLLAASKVVCLIGFPLVPMLVDLSNLHPGLPGNTAAEEIGSLAGAAGRWSQVHAAFWVGGLLALGAVLVLRAEVARRAPVLVTNAAAAVGVVGAGIFTGTVYMEIRVIPALSTACSRSPLCLDPDNAVFTNALAAEGWRVLPGLTLGAKMLVLGLALLAVLGFTYGALKSWEAVALFTGGVWEYGVSTGLHAWGNFSPSRGMPGLAALAILFAGASVSWRMVSELRTGGKPAGKPGEEAGAGAAGAPPQSV